MAESSDCLFILSISHFFRIIILAILLLLVFLLYVQYNIRVLAGIKVIVAMWMLLYQISLGPTCFSVGR